jgi:hypothetical protein
MKESTKNMALRVFLFVTLGILLLPFVNAQEPPVDNQKPCIFYAYTESGNHNFLMKNGSSLFGDNLKIIHNCESLTIYVNSEFYAQSNSSLDVKMNYGYQNITIESEDSISFYQNVVFYPDQLQWESQYNQLFQIPETELISIDTSNTRENWASILSIVIVWVLTTYVYWKLIESYVNKNFIEEVVK